MERTDFAQSRSLIALVDRLATLGRILSRKNKHIEHDKTLLSTHMEQVTTEEGDAKNQDQTQPIANENLSGDSEHGTAELPKQMA